MATHRIASTQSNTTLHYTSLVPSRTQILGLLTGEIHALDALLLVPSFLQGPERATKDVATAGQYLLDVIYQFGGIKSYRDKVSLSPKWGCENNHGRKKKMELF